MTVMLKVESNLDQSWLLASPPLHLLLSTVELDSEASASPATSKRLLALGSAVVLQLFVVHMCALKFAEQLTFREA